MGHRDVSIPEADMSCLEGILHHGPMMCYTTDDTCTAGVCTPAVHMPGLQYWHVIPSSVSQVSMCEHGTVIHIHSQQYTAGVVDVSQVHMLLHHGMVQYLMRLHHMRYALSW